MNTFFKKISMTNKIVKIKLAVIIIGSLYLAISSFKRGSTRDLDFKVFHKVAKRVVSGETNLFDYKKDGIFSYKYSPFASIIFTPLSLLSREYAQLIWSFLNVIATIIGFYLSWIVFVHFHGIPERKVDIILLTLIMLARPILNNAMQGNINSFQYLLMILPVYLAVIKNHLYLPATILSLAISIKIVPVTMLGFFIFTKRFKIYFLTSLITIILFLIPFLYWDVDTATRMYHDWYLVLKDKEHFPFFKWTNQSPYVVWFKILGNNLWAKAFYYMHFVLSLYLLVKTVSQRQWSKLLALCIIVILILSPVVWIEYSVILIYPFLLLNSMFFKNDMKWKTFFWTRFVFLYCFGKFLVGREIAETITNYGQVYWGLMMMIVLIYFMDKKTIKS